MDPEQFTKLWIRVQPAVAAYIGSLVRDFHDAEDILQSVATVLLQKRDEYHTDQPFENWAIGVSKRQVLSYFKRGRTDRHVFDEGLVESFTEEYQAAAASDDAERIGRALDTCLEQVHGRGRTALALRYGEGLSPTAIAAKLAISSGAVRTLLYRVREALRACIQREMGRVEASR